jgi:NAD(P)-dependent dehydrogenase (short-subunit alcohol dehydrogenase family)
MKTVLVTGGSSGIGEATAKRLAADGHTVYAAARRVERMAGLEALGITPLQMDITKDADVVRVIDHIAAERGGIDVLVNNAGFATYGAMEDTSIDDARYQFEVNLFGLARLTQLALPFMREQRAGTIVNISSMGGKIYTPLGAWYHATKHALEGWSDCLRFELAPFGIHVVIIEPGLIKTEFGDVMIGPMLERSGETAYAPVAKRIAEATRNTYEGGAHSPPTGVADAIGDAVRAGRPKTRYAVGRMARSSIWARTYLGDRVFDWVLRSRM